MNTCNKYNLQPEVYNLLLQAGAHETYRLDGVPMLVLTTANGGIQEFVKLLEEALCS